METKEQSSIAVINELFLYAQLQMQFTQQVFIELLGTKCYLKYWDQKRGWTRSEISWSSVTEEEIRQDISAWDTGAEIRQGISA